MSVSDLIKQDMQTDEYWTEIAKLEFISALNKQMVDKDMSRSDFARAIGRSPAYVTKIMQGDSNLTIESMVKFARAVGMRFSPVIVQQQTISTPKKVSALMYHTKQPVKMVANYGK